MNTQEIIGALDEHIVRLTRVKELLTGLGRLTKGPGRPKGTSDLPAAVEGAVAAVKGRRTMSAEGRARIAAAQRARWAKRDAPAASKKSTRSADGAKAKTPTRARVTSKKTAAKTVGVKAVAVKKSAAKGAGSKRVSPQVAAKSAGEAGAQA